MNMTREFAYKVWGVLNSYASASDTGGDGFVRAIMAHNTNRVFEYRFIGNLDFGGKVYFDGNKFYVDCYREDLNDLRMLIIKRTNEELDKLMEENNVKAE